MFVYYARELLCEQFGYIVLLFELGDTVWLRDALDFYTVLHRPPAVQK